MTRTQNSKRNFSNFVATAMLITGSAALVIYSAAIAWQFHATLDSTKDALGFFGSLGLASLHMIRAMTLDHAAVLSVQHHLLILFSAFLVMLAGIALLARRATGVNASGTHNFSAPPKGDR